MRWRNQDGTIRKHPDDHHAHRVSGTPVYHDKNDPEVCWHLQQNGHCLDPKQGLKHMLQGTGEDHHHDLDHQH